MHSPDVYFDIIAGCKIGDYFGGFAINDAETLEKVKCFFEERGAKVQYDPRDPKTICISPSLYLIATSKPYSIYEDDIGNEVWVELWGKKCNSGLFAYNGQVLYVLAELKNFISSNPKQTDFIHDQAQSCYMPKCVLS